MTLPWPLPVQAYVPGETPRPETSPAFDAAAAAPSHTDPDNWATNATYLYGVALYEAAFFWEAHEVWEPVWMHAPPNSTHRALVQGLIQLANACLKLRMGRGNAARRLLDISVRHVAASGTAPLMGFRPAELGAEITRFRESHPLDLAVRPELQPEYAL